MALPAGVQKLGEFKGAKGDTGSLAFLTGEYVNWDQPFSAEIVGPPEARGAHIKLPMALPSAETVSNDEATAALIAAVTKTREAIERMVLIVENVYHEDQIAPAIARIVARGAGVLAIPFGATITMNAPVVLPHAVRRFTINGRIIINGNFTPFARSGSVVGDYTAIDLAVNAGNRDVFASWSDLAVDDWAMVASVDTLPGTSDKLGYLRQVRSLVPGKVTLDVPIPRNMPTTTNRRLRKVRMAPSILCDGDGEIYYADPNAATSTMFTFTFVEGVIMKGIFAHDGGATCVSVRHCVTVDIDIRIDRMMDDLPNGHVGYGVNVGGACREVIVRGFIARTRHSVTTNPGPGEDIVPEFPFYGEPENFSFMPVTRFCSDKAIDTHRAGYGGRIIANDMGSGGVVQVRCDAVYVEVRSTGNFFGDIVTIGPDLVGVTVVGPVIASWGNAAVIRAFSDVMCTAFPVAYGGNPTLFAIAAGVSLETPTPTQFGPIAGDQDFGSATAAAITGMLGKMAVSAIYLFEADVTYRAANTVDGKIGFTAPPGATVNWSLEGLPIDTTSSIGTTGRQSFTLADEAQFGAVATGVDNSLKIRGRAVNGATPGYLQMRAGQRVDTPGSPLRIRAGSYLKMERVR